MAKPAFKMRFDLLALDVIGSVLLGLGLAKKFANLDLLPTAFQLDATWMIGLGVLLMLPFFLSMTGQIRANAEGKRFK